MICFSPLFWHLVLARSVVIPVYSSVYSAAGGFGLLRFQYMASSSFFPVYGQQRPTQSETAYSTEQPPAKGTGENMIDLLRVTAPKQSTVAFVIQRSTSLDALAIPAMADHSPVPSRSLVSPSPH